MTETGTRQNPGSIRTIAVFGASGHTGRFVVAALQQRGLPIVAVGRDAERLAALPAQDARVTSLEDPVALDRAFDGASVVINCAGPFLDTAAPIIGAALRAGASYLDVTAEQQAVRDTFSNYGEVAREAGVKIVPAAAFYGGLSDLLAHAAMKDWSDVDVVRTGYALDSWHPTHGTRITGERNRFARVILAERELITVDPSAATPPWDFPPPFNLKPMEEVPFSEIIVLSKDAGIANARSFINTRSLADVRNPATPVPVAADEIGRSAQNFLVEVVVERGGVERRAVASGRDIYAATGPIIAEAAERIFKGRTKTLDGGVFTLSELFDPGDFLASIAARYPGFEFQLSNGEVEHD